MIGLVSKYLLNWKAGLVFVGLAFASGLWTGNRLSDVGHYKSANKALTEALNASERAKQKELENAKKLTIEKNRIHANSRYRIKLLQEQLDDKDCGNTAMGRVSIGVLQPTNR